MPPTGAGISTRRPSLYNPIPATTPLERYSDSRTHGKQGPSRHVRIPRATSYGGGAIATSEDRQRCVVAGKESLRILRISEPDQTQSTEHKFVIGRGGYRIDASRNLWSGSGLKIDSVSTDVVWGHGIFNNKILTSARNGELILWDLNKAGPSKFERRIKEHIRSVNRLAYSTVLQHYCITGSADGDIRVWDLRDLTGSIMKIHHPASVRAVAFSPIPWQPRHAITGLDNGYIHHWDLNMGQRGQLNRIPLAHTGPILTLDWTLSSTLAANTSTQGATAAAGTQSSNWYSSVGSGLFDDLGGFGATAAPAVSEPDGAGMGWLASGGLDKCVKVWDLTAPAGETHVSRRPTYTLHTSFPVRRVLWRPGYECELAVVSNLDFGAGSQSNHPDSATTGPSSSPRMSYLNPTENVNNEEEKSGETGRKGGDPIEIWDVRRGYTSKWIIRGSAIEGGVTDVAFVDSHTMWTQHFSGAFSQLDMQYSTRSLDIIPRTAVTWDSVGTMVFVADKPKRSEPPYDDINPELKNASKKAKALGDKSYVPQSQTIGVVTGHGLNEDAEIFAKLAHGYVYEGTDRQKICSRNAEVAAEAGKHDVTQVWSLLSSLLTDIYIPEPPTPSYTLSPLPFSSPKLPHSNSAPAAIPTVSRMSTNDSTNLVRSTRAFSEEIQVPSVGRNSPSSRSGSGSGSRSRGDKDRSSSASGIGYLSPLRTTPVSSATSSPHRPNSPLPHIPPSVPASVFARRGSNGGLPGPFGGMGMTPVRSRLGSSYRRPSFGGLRTMTADSVPDVRSVSHSSLRHVGDGALDDSDSEGSDSDERDTSRHTISEEDESAVDDTGEQESGTYRPASAVPPYLYTRSTSTSVQPSPLSRVAGQQSWTDDEKEEEDSPSPASTDSESASDDLDFLTGLSPRPSGSRRSSFNKPSSRRSSMRSGKKTRSRSSTVASLAAPDPLVTTSPAPARLIKQDSQSSIRTVTATHTPTSIYAPDRDSLGHSRDQSRFSGIQGEETVRDHSKPGFYTISAVSGTYMGPKADIASMRSVSLYHSHRPRSDVVSIDLEPDPEQETTEGKVTRNHSASRNNGESAQRAIREAEKRLREAGWQAFRETFEVLADEGDIQTCTMLALVAPKELKIPVSRTLRLLESYIELLSRMRLHTAAAYMRKFSPAEDVRNTTSLHTTLYTTCGICRKPLLLPASKKTGKPAGSYAFCLGCQKTSTKCTICHLPVRGLLFKCNVCMHGGHQECYQQYYLRQPLTELSSAPPESSPQTGSGNLRSLPPTPDLRGRGRARSRAGDADGSADGVSARDGDDDESRHRSTDRNANQNKNVVLGHLCAAGCGHHCWATNDVLRGGMIFAS